MVNIQANQKKEKFRGAYTRRGHLTISSRGNKYHGPRIGPVGDHRYSHSGYSWHPHLPYGVYLPQKPCKINEDCPFRNCTQSGFCEN